MHFVNVIVLVKMNQFSIFCWGINPCCLWLCFTLTFVEQAQYKIPIQYTQDCSRGAPSSSPYLPLKVNPAGVIPIILLVRSQLHRRHFPSNECYGLQCWMGRTTAQSMLSTNTPTRCR